MALVVARIDCQSSKTVKGTLSRSQYVMRSDKKSVKFRTSHRLNRQLTVALFGK